MTADALSRNVRRLGHLDLPGGGQVIFDGKGHAIVGHMKPPYGTTILDVSDPARPTVVSEIRLDDDQSHTHKVRVAGDIMITNVEENERHAKRRAGRLKALEAGWAARHGRPPTDAELAAALKVKPEAIPGLRRIQPRPYDAGRRSRSGTSPTAAGRGCWPISAPSASASTASTWTSATPISRPRWKDTAATSW